MSDDDDAGCDTESYALRYDHCLKEAKWVQKALSDMLTEGPRSRGTVCVAGSASLHWFLLTYPKDGFAKCCLFQPNDVDIFVCGADGQTQSAFKDTVYGMVDRLRDKGYTVRRISVWKNPYILQDTPVLIINVRVGERRVNLSFIQCPKDSAPEQVVARFDINIVQVIYDVAKGEFRMEEGVRRSIEARKAETKAICCRFTAPNNDEMFKIRSTLCRIGKYRRRGFSFNTCLQPKLYTAYPSTVPPVTSFREHKQLQNAVVASEIANDIISFLKEIFPEKVLKRGVVGLFGELALMKFCADEQCRVSPSVVAPWEVDAANVCICSLEAASTVSFRRALQRLKSRMRASSTYAFKYRNYVGTRLDGMADKVDVVEYNVRELRPIRIRFIRCPWAKDVGTFAQQSLIGVERVWYDFEEERCKLGCGVEEQLRTGVVEVDDVVLPTSVPRLIDISTYATILHRMWYYHVQGFTFRQYPALITPSVC